MNEKINLWVFWYCSCIHESSSFPMSYHKTKEGAEKAMNEHRDNEKKNWDKMGMSKAEFGLQFGKHDSWSIEPFELEIMP